MPQSLTFVNPDFERLGRQIEYCAKLKLPMAQPDSLAHVPGVVICGLGTSLENGDVIREIRRLHEDGWPIVTMKEGLAHLHDTHGLFARYNMNMDPGLGDLDRTHPREGVTYFVASSCHPRIFRKLLNAGCDVRVYHNACGFPSEVHLYEILFTNHYVVGGGFTVLNRAMSLFYMMGAQNQVLAGADFGLRDESKYYASFVGAEPWKQHWMNDGGEVDGTPWITKPDLLASAAEVARLIQDGYKIRILGDSLAASLAKRDREFIDRCSTVTPAEGNKSGPTPQEEADGTKTAD